MARLGTPPPGSADDADSLRDRRVTALFVDRELQQAVQGRGLDAELLRVGRPGAPSSRRVETQPNQGLMRRLLGGG